MRRVNEIPGSEPAPAPRAQAARPIILYVEDEDQNWDVAKLRLADAFVLLRASTAEDACRTLRERGPELSAILMDIELRGSELNGVELTELFRGKLPRRDLPSYARGLPVVTKPIIFVTAHGARYTDVELMLFGADRVIQKPVNFAALNLALAGIQLTETPRRGW